MHPGHQDFVHSVPGTGSIFRVVLPMAEAGTEDAAVPVTRAEGGSGSILVVEDDDAVRSIVSAMLQKAGYSVTTAEGGDQALEICRSPGREFDLVVTDLVMPGMRGTEVAAWITERHPRTRIVIMTGYKDETTRTCGDCAVLHKPFEPAELLSTVRQAIGGRD